MRIPLYGRFYWKLVFDMDNTENSGTITHWYRCKLVEKFWQSVFISSFLWCRPTHHTRSPCVFGVVAAIVNVEEASGDATEVANFISSVGMEAYIERESHADREIKFEIGPNSKMELYQRVFVAPGITFACDSHSTTNKPDEQVMIFVDVAVREFVSGIKVVRTWLESDKPVDAIGELLGGSANINHGFGPSFIWLVPEYTRSKENACTGFEIVLQQTTSDAQFIDLTPNDTYPYRYLKAVKDPCNMKKVVDVGLLRCHERPSDVAGMTGGAFTDMTERLTSRRGKDFLHLLFKTEMTGKI